MSERDDELEPEVAWPEPRDDPEAEPAEPWARITERLEQERLAREPDE